MNGDVSGERVAGQILREFSAAISSVVTTAYEAAHRFESDDALLAPRNTLLTQLATHVGKQKEYEGALHLVKNGDPLVHYQSEEHLERLIARRKKIANTVAELACDTCPFRWECGVGPKQLQQELRDKGDRRRFRDRIRRQPLNNRMCERNLSPQRIVSKRLSV